MRLQPFELIHSLEACKTLKTAGQGPSLVSFTLFRAAELDNICKQNCSELLQFFPESAFAARSPAFAFRTEGSCFASFLPQTWGLAPY